MFVFLRLSEILFFCRNACFRAVDAGITILNEVGLDPGIDHMTAMECFDEVRDRGGKVSGDFEEE